MATAAPPKRMVSSVFITLASPYRGTVTQQQRPTLQAHSSPVIDNQSAPHFPISCCTTFFHGNNSFTRNAPSTSAPSPADPSAHFDPRPAAGLQRRDVCGFCRKSVNLSEPAIEALNRTYHEACFQCRSCHIPLAGKQYFNKAGIPLCEDCYQASLELCWACGEVIKYQVMRALERAYHPQCFMCTTCKQQIGEQRFAQGEVGEVYCLPDYYRKYAPKCNACNQLIIPKEDGTDSFTIECLGNSYHEDCYRCEMCFINLTPEPNERGCYPLDGKLLCKACHLSLVSAHGQ
uniref:LIM zinc-binding domain-containing protein n=1 Tax=Periophthalmus magnuspinnatus TaxID=409849 RepID=A0A3B3ZI32_9GOBI